MKISPLEISLGAFCLGYLFNNIDYINFGLAIYQSCYIEPLKIQDEKENRIDTTE